SWTFHISLAGDWRRMSENSAAFASNEPSHGGAPATIRRSGNLTGKEPGKAAGLSTEALPDAGDEAIGHGAAVCLPSAVFREHSFLGMNAVEEGRPSGNADKRNADIPFMEVVADVAQEVGEIEGMPHDTVWTSGRQASQGRTQAKQPAD